MRLNTDTGIQTEGTLGGDIAAMGVDLSRLNHIMNVLTDLYSDQELACIREYSTNALDAQIEAGYKGPIKVSLPTALRQTFEVSDRGTGLSKDQIMKVYGTYGTSTKTNSDDFNGCLGLGSKSALTYTDMFIVRSNKDGKHIEATIYRNAEGAGSIEVVSETDTTEPNGTTVVIPTRASSQFKDKALRFYSVWEAGTVEVAGETIKHVRDNGIRLADNLYVVSNNGEYKNYDYVVMGNVAYPIDKRESNQYVTAYHFVGMGDVEFVPSREALNFTERTKRTIMDLRSKGSIRDLLARMAKSDIAAAATLDDAGARRHKWKTLYSTDPSAKWNGIDLVDSHSLGSLVDTAGVRRSNDRARRRFAFLDATEASENYIVVDRINFETAEKYAILTNTPSTGVVLSAKAKAQIRAYIKANNLKVEFVNPFNVFGTIRNSVTERVVRIDWEQIRKIEVKVERGTPKPKKAVAEYSWRRADGTKSGYGSALAPLPAGTKLILVNNQSIAHDWASLSQDKDEVFVWMPSTRIAKFKRENTYTTQDDYEKKIIASLPVLTDYMKVRLDLAGRYWYGNATRIYIESDLDFDDTMNKVRAVNLDEAKKVAKAHRAAGFDIKNDTTIIRDFDKRFPLADTNFKRHSIVYMQAIANS